MPFNRTIRAVRACQLFYLTCRYMQYNKEKRQDLFSRLRRFIRDSNPLFRSVFDSPRHQLPLWRTYIAALGTVLHVINHGFVPHFPLDASLNLHFEFECNEERFSGDCLVYRANFQVGTKSCVLASGQPARAYEIRLVDFIVLGFVLGQGLVANTDRMCAVKTVNRAGSSIDYGLFCEGFDFGFDFEDTATLGDAAEAVARAKARKHSTVDTNLIIRFVCPTTPEAT